jgi:hypothetical protein
MLMASALSLAACSHASRTTHTHTHARCEPSPAPPPRAPGYIRRDGSTIGKVGGVIAARADPADRR